MTEAIALRHDLGGHIGMIVETNVIICKQTRQVARGECIAMDRDRRIVRLADAGKHWGKLVIAVYEDGFHDLVAHGSLRP